ncbi:MAG TPA: SAM-dependent methyltransferase [Stellaceae bacterium]|nr:SAM-dependent methyltransferase [Stellaceae bacterium]
MSEAGPPPAAPTPLAQSLAAQIRRDGPIGVDRFMALALAAYYPTRDPFGRAGDFVTAPEVSQIFGEVLGLWCAQAWQDIGAPDPVHLVELGPGRGTMMADMLRAARVLPGFLSAIQVHLVETSPVLREAQRRNLEGLAPLAWHDGIAGLPTGPMLLVANEFLDALPIRQWVRRGARWLERKVGLDQSSRFIFCEGPGTPDAVLPAAAPEGALFETAAPARNIARHIGRRLATAPGAALFIDYGHAQTGFGETLQAVHRHGKVSALDMPGEADLTSHVDFQALGHALADAGARVFGPETQGAFLASLGAGQRAQRLMQGKPDNLREEIAKGLHRLVDPGQMGTIFKVLGAASPSVAALPGLAAPKTT